MDPEVSPTDKQYVDTYSAPYLSTIWIMSVLCVVTGLGYFLFPFEGEKLEFTLYYLSGLCIGIFLLVKALQHFKVGFKVNGRVLLSFRIVLTTLAAIGFLFFTLKQFSYGAALAAAIMSSVMIWFFRMPRRSAAVCLLFHFVLWQLFAKLKWWSPFDEGLFNSPHTFFIFIVALLIAAWWICSEHKWQKVSRYFEWIITASFLMLFLVCATRQELDFHHWSFFLGPIQLLRQGHWLLWDVPSQYGFLNIFLAYILPFKSPLTSFYVLNATALFVSALLSYKMLCSHKRNFSTLIFAGLLVFVTTFLLPGMAQYLVGPAYFPSVGAFRFIWCSVLVYICVSILHSRKLRPPTQQTLIIGTIAWTLAIFWSFESAIYASCIWLPFCAIIHWKALEEKHQNYFVRGILVLRNIFLAALLPIASALAVWAFYKIELGHGPDWYAYIEYALTYKNGFSAVLIDYNGAVWTLLFVLSILTAMAIFQIKKKSVVEFAVATAIIGLVWGTGSYFVSRSHDNNICNLSPLIVFALSASLISALPFWRLALQSILAAIFVIGTTATLGNPESFHTFASTILNSRSFDELHEQLPSLPDTHTKFLSKIGCGPDDPIGYLESTLFPAWPPSKYFYKLWIPLAPATQFFILSEERQKIYLQRFLEKDAVRSGCLAFFIDEEFNPELISSHLSKYYEAAEHYKISDKVNDDLFIYKFKKKDNLDFTNGLTR
jgi:hypothetical protein